MENLTSRPDSVATLDNSALSNFAKALKANCGDTVSVFKDATIPVIDKPGINISVDAKIDYFGFTVAVIKLVETDDQLRAAKLEVTNTIKKTYCSLGIVITKSGDYYFRSYEKKNWSKPKFVKLKEKIEEVFNAIIKDPKTIQIKKILLSIFDNAQDFDNKGFVRGVFEKACDDLQFNFGKITFKEADEIELMQILLGGSLYKVLEVCRYTTLNSLFLMLNGKTHAMCCPISMNDNTEGSYADSFMPWNVKQAKDIQEIKNDNSYFLLSCTDIKKYDTLTMWRLYAEDAKGVCIKYHVDASKIDSNKYFFARVSYGERGISSKPEHKELKFISDLQEPEICPGWRFYFSKWYIWKYFFKSWTYKDESEIRLIYLPDLSNKAEKDRIIWYKDYNYSIFNRMALIPIEDGKTLDFPLTIKQITLAPQSPNAYKNREQIQFMVEDKKIKIATGFSVDVSSISNYR